MKSAYEEVLEQESKITFMFNANKYPTNNVYESGIVW